MTIIDKLNSFSLVPKSQGWEDLDPLFIKKYEQFQSLKEMNNDGTYDAEIEQMDKELVGLFNELHQVDELPEKLEETKPENPKNETDDGNKTITDMPPEKTPEQNTESEEKTEEEPEKIKAPGTEMQQKSEPEKKKEPIVEVFQPSQELLAFLGQNDTVYASDLRKFNVPRKNWNENKPSFKVGVFKLEKTNPASLLLNVWSVTKRD